jgi:TolB-like protein
MIAPVTPLKEEPTPQPTQAQTIARNSHLRRLRSIAWITIPIAVVVACGIVLYPHLASNKRPPALASSAPPQASVGVLPFLDLTEGMHSEEFADGMTEELIDKLSKVPALSVPSATSSFFYKGKQLSVSEIAQGLHVNYLLDGSVRKSSGRVRIAARLVRADNSYVLWTETYDRPFDDLIMVQDDIAGEVAKALKASIVPSSHGKTP